MVRLLTVFLAISVSVSAAQAVPLPERADAELFLVQNPELLLLGPDGREKERFGATNGALSPDGRWLACIDFDKTLSKCSLAIHRRSANVEPLRVPLVWDAPGASGCLPVWTADSRRLLIGENRPGKDGALEYAYRAYELATKDLRELSLPSGHWVTSWSTDGKRLLTTARTGEGAARIAWINTDGAGNPEFLTPEDEVAYSPRLSRDGRKMVYQAGPQVMKSQRTRVRLYVMDLASKKRTVVDEPGETHGFCFSPDGRRVAYTWQRSIDKPADVPERETFLITCDLDGKNRKTVTSRKYKPVNAAAGVVYFFWVLDWR